MANNRGALAENIAFLSQFANQGRTLTDPIVELLSLNIKPRKEEAGCKRVLTFDEERRLAEVFALILAINDKPSRVGAVCIEEQPHGSGFIVRFAANSGTFQEEKETVFNRFINAARLGRKSDQSWPLLIEIVEAHQLRILRRLRSKHGPKPKNNGPVGQPIIEQLHSAITRIPKSRRSSANYQRVKEFVDSWLMLFKNLERLSVSDARSKEGARILVKIILGLSAGFDITQFADLLSTARSNESPWPHSSHERILRAYRKISQYKSAADYIDYMVRRHGTWDLQFASCGPYENHAVGAQPVGTGNLGLYRRSVADRSAKKRKDFQTAVVQRLGKSLSKVETSMERAIEVHKKVHAEIQLVYHYAQHTTSGFTPRVLCSSKEACYLCYLFIKVHGHFHTPRSHGNFYPEWRLPRMDEIVLSREPMSQMKQVIREFNLAIEQRLSSLLQVPRVMRPIPSESTIFSMGSCAPTAVISSAEVGVTSPLAAYQTCLGTSHSTDTANVIASAIALTSKRSDTTLDVQTSFSANASENESGQTGQSSATVLRTEQIYQIQHGRKTKLKIPKGGSVYLSTPKIRFEFTFESNEATSTKTAFAILVLEWLLTLESSSNAAHVNIEDLIVDQDVSCSSILSKDGVVFHGEEQLIFMQVYSIT